MPTYVYECQACGNTLERRQSFSDAPLTTHEECGGSLRRLLWPAPVIFKGSGFYNTDYKNGSSSTKGETSSNGSAEGAKAESKGDSPKTESKVESVKTDSGTSSTDKATASV